jgi:tryptophan 7-halogenase
MQQSEKIKDIVIVGGGTAGWMTAASLSRVMGNNCNVTLIESDDIGTVGVGEATIPMIRLFNRVLGIDEDEFVKATMATFKLGIQFANWGGLGEQYIHGFGKIGQELGLLPFYPYWMKLHQAGLAGPLEEYSINTAACLANKFMRPVTAENSPLGDIAYAFHFDAILYARFLRQYSEKRGVRRLEGRVGEVRTTEAGWIRSVVLSDGREIAGELFVDCSGFKGLLIEEALHTGYDDWTHWLPCDSAWAVPCQSTAPAMTPYTRSTAHTAGWQWRIPLQHRVGNGHVYASRFMSDDEARSVLVRHVEGELLAEPRQLKFKTGKRKKTWNKNCVAIGLSSGFMEPLESTSIHLIQSTIGRLLEFFPDRSFSQPDIDEFNNQVDFEVEKIRDFLILHYKATRRSDSDFWNYCRTMDVPDSLAHRMRLFETHGRIYRLHDEMFTTMSWLQVMHGQGLKAQAHHPLVDSLPMHDVAGFAADVKSVIERCVAVMPSHEEFIQQHCRAEG